MHSLYVVRSTFDRELAVEFEDLDLLPAVRGVLRGFPLRSHEFMPEKARRHDPEIIASRQIAFVEDLGCREDGIPRLERGRMLTCGVDQITVT